MIWPIALITVTLAGAGLVLYAVKSRSREGGKTAALKAIEEEMARLKVIAAELDRRSREMDVRERRMQERVERLNRMFKQAEESLIRNSVNHDTLRPQGQYERAMDMLRTGVPADEIMRTLGLLDGEVRLITSLNGIKN